MSQQPDLSAFPVLFHHYLLHVNLCRPSLQINQDRSIWEELKEEVSIDENCSMLSNTETLLLLAFIDFILDRIGIGVGKLDSSYLPASLKPLHHAGTLICMET